jgi:hypothetical protein
MAMRTGVRLSPSVVKEYSTFGGTSRYKVFCIIDASGNWSRMATDLTVARIAQAGAIPIDTYAVLAELMSTWNRPDAMQFAQVMVDHVVPPYRALMESYDKAQDVQKVGHETRLDLLKAAQAKKGAPAPARGSAAPVGGTVSAAARPFWPVNSPRSSSWTA